MTQHIFSIYRSLSGSNKVELQPTPLAKPFVTAQNTANQPNQPISENRNNNNSNYGDFQFRQMQTITPQWAKENRDTFICYSCSEGSIFYI